MAKDDEKFSKYHSFPSSTGLDALFRFMSIDLENSSYVEDLLTHSKLYHATTAQLNDPFERKPKFQIEPNPKKSLIRRKHLTKILRKSGFSSKDAEKEVSRRMANPKLLEKTIRDTAHEILALIRTCSFTTQHNNLLLWSHYASSHTGICIRFDAKKSPAKFAFKVCYRNEYPKIEYPPEFPQMSLVPALTKSREWEYENEYRTMKFPGTKLNFPKDGPFVYVPENAITDVFLGASIDRKKEDIVLKAIEKGPFKPKIWKAKLSEIEYKLEFNIVEK